MIAWPAAGLRQGTEHRYVTLEIPTHVLQLTLFTNLIETTLLHILSTILSGHTPLHQCGELYLVLLGQSTDTSPRDSNPCITAYSVHKLDRNKSLVHTLYQCYLTHHYTSVGALSRTARDRAQIRHPRDSNPCITAYSFHKLDRNKSLVHTLYQCNLDTHTITPVWGALSRTARDRAQIRHPRDSNPCITAYSFHKLDRNKSLVHTLYQCYLEHTPLHQCGELYLVLLGTEHRYVTLEIPTHVLQLTLFTNLIETSLLYILSTSVIWTHTITPVWGALSRTARDRAQIRHPRDSNPCITAYSFHKLDRNKSLVHTIYQCYLDTHHYTSVGSFISYC
ncbi:hypothetical protein J6590_078713 [Homalodisca vitripennis]|nr:hypothetical protein J6590_078713 [Homalodisca vitripennis]